jgi:phage repressor protein C with HTH and peptisase S24 domain
LKYISFTYIVALMPANPLPPEEIALAAKLKQRFVAWQFKQKQESKPASQEAAAGILGFNQSALNQYLNGKIPLNLEVAIKFSELLDCTVFDISPRLADQGAKYAASLEAPTASRDQNPTLMNSMRVRAAEKLPNTIPIKRVQLKLQAGITGFETQPDDSDGGTIDFPIDVIEQNDFVAQCLIAIRVRGRSMEPMLFEDDVVVINIADTKPVSGEIYAINFDGEAVVKQLIFQSKDWWMYSINQAGDFPRRLCRGGDCIIVGRVVYQPGRMLTRRL